MPSIWDCDHILPTCIRQCTPRGNSAVRRLTADMRTEIQSLFKEGKSDELVLRYCRQRLPDIPVSAADLVQVCMHTAVYVVLTLLHTGICVLILVLRN